MLTQLNERETAGPGAACAALAQDHLRLHAERARGEAELSVGSHGIRRLREGGSLKIRLPSGSSQAILINTAGGIAGGDRYSVSLGAEAEGRLTVTSQAAERVYRSLGPPARFSVRARADAETRLCWLPQETILFDGAAIHREIEVDLAETASFLGLEATVLGRKESGETVRHVDFRENWTIRRADKIIHAERFRLSGAPPASPATLGHARALATLILVSPDAESRLQACLSVLGDRSGVSAWNGRLVARLAAADGFHLRKDLLRLLPLLLPSSDLPRLWLL